MRPVDGACMLLAWPRRCLARAWPRPTTTGWRHRIKPIWRLSIAAMANPPPRKKQTHGSAFSRRSCMIPLGNDFFPFFNSFFWSLWVSWDVQQLFFPLHPQTIKFVKGLVYVWYICTRTKHSTQDESPPRTLRLPREYSKTPRINTGVVYREGAGHGSSLPSQGSKGRWYRGNLLKLAQATEARRSLSRPLDCKADISGRLSGTVTGRACAGRQPQSDHQNDLSLFGISLLAGQRGPSPLGELNHGPWQVGLNLEKPVSESDPGRPCSAFRPNQSQ